MNELLGSIGIGILALLVVSAYQGVPLAFVAYLGKRSQDRVEIQQLRTQEAEARVQEAQAKLDLARLKG